MTNDVDSCKSERGNKQQRPGSGETYELRPRPAPRWQQRGRDAVAPRSRPTARQRPPPLSKYRRRTANARERHRMREMNAAFQALRGALPEVCRRRAAAAMTKITTLRLAVNYIRALSHLLQDSDPPQLSQPRPAPASTLTSHDEGVMDLLPDPCLIQDALASLPELPPLPDSDSMAFFLPDHDPLPCFASCNGLSHSQPYY